MIVTVKRAAELLFPFVTTELAVNTFCTDAQKSGTKNEEQAGTVSLSVVVATWVVRSHSG
jgi:hypothetical protein